MNRPKLLTPPRGGSHGRAPSRWLPVSGCRPSKAEHSFELSFYCLRLFSPSSRVQWHFSLPRRPPPTIVIIERLWLRRFCLTCVQRRENALSLFPLWKIVYVLLVLLLLTLKHRVCESEAYSQECAKREQKTTTALFFSLSTLVPLCCPYLVDWLASNWLVLNAED
jgi:hypothetical protein